MTDKTEIYFKNFTLLDDAELRQVYEWRNLDYIRLKMDNPQIFPFEEHLKFADLYQVAPTRSIFRSP